MTAVTDEYARALEVRDAEAKRQRELSEEIAGNREAHRERWEETEMADAHRQINEAEAIMRMPTPQAHKALGTPKSDARRGPSS